MAKFNVGNGHVALGVRPGNKHFLRVEEDFGGDALLELTLEQLKTLANGILAYVRTQK